MNSRQQTGRVPCTECIQRASDLRGSGNIALPQLCSACKATLARVAGHKDRHQMRSQSPHIAPSSIKDTATKHFSNPHEDPTQSETIVSNEHQVSPAWSALTRSESLGQLTQKFIDVVNERDFTNPIWYRAAIGIEVEALDNYHPTTTLAENIQTFKKIASESPEYHLHVLDIDILETEDGLTAESYINMQVTGRPIGLVINSVGRMQWRRKDQHWSLTSFTAMRFPEPS